MADQEHLKIFTNTITGVSDYKDWLDFKNSVDQVDLTQIDMSNKKLSNLNLSRVNFSGANFYNCEMVGVDLTGANLNYANLNRVNLSSSFLDQASLAGADMQGANLVDTSLNDANLAGAKLCGTHMVGSQFVGANLSSANLRGANMKFAVLTGANLRNTIVDETDLSGVDIDEETKSIMKGVDTAIFSKKPKPKKSPTEADLMQSFKEEDAFAILDLKPNATMDDVIKAYKSKAKEYHPDKVSHLGDKLKQLAQMEFDRINKAKEYLTKNLRNPNVGKAPVESEPERGRPICMEDYIRAAEQNPNDDVVWYNLGVHYQQEGFIQESIKAYKRCLAINPNNNTAQHNLKVALLKNSYNSNE